MKDKHIQQLTEFGNNIWEVYALVLYLYVYTETRKGYFQLTTTTFLS